MRRTLGPGLAAGCVLALTAACGSGGSGGPARPGTDTIADALRGGSSVLGSMGNSMTRSVTDCVAEVLHDSDLSDSTLRALVEGDEDYQGTDAEKRTLVRLTPKISGCAARQAE